MVAKETYTIVRSIYNGITEKSWSDLTEEEIIKVEEYYKFREYRNDRRLQIMAREASIQLVYQNALTPFLGGSRLLYKIWPPKLFFQTTKRRKLEIFQHSSFSDY